MSGPKLSEAELERLRQEQLERERQEALLKLREAQSAYRDAKCTIEDIKINANLMLDDIDSMYRANAKNDICAALGLFKVGKIQDESDIDEYNKATSDLNSQADIVSSKIKDIIDKYVSKAQTDKKLNSADKIHKSFQKYLGMSTDPIDVTSIDFKSNYDQSRLMKKVDDMLSHYSWLSVHGQTDEIKSFAQKCQVMVTVEVINKADKVSRNDITSLLQKLINEETDIIRRFNEKQRLYDEYVALKAYIGEDAKEMDAFEDVSMLQKEISELNYSLRKKDEMDYIADQINDAMVSLGYGFVTSKVLTRKDKSEMDCSLYQADDETGIAIYTDQTGAVMMRMTVLGEDEEITEEDREFSLQRQIDFCAGHEDIVDALAKRGVYLKQKSYLEPDKKHTYKVNMNNTDSAVTKDASGQTVLRKDKVDRRRRRRGNKKKVRAM